MKLSSDDAQEPIHKPTPSKKKSKAKAPLRIQPATCPVSTEIFNVPTDEAPIRKISPKPRKVSPFKTSGAKVTKPKAASKPLIPPPRPAPNVFDMPSSGDEAKPPKPKPAQKLSRKIAAVPDVEGKQTLKTNAEVVEEDEGRKRLKLSPAHDLPSPKPLPLPLPSSTLARRPKPKVAVKPVNPLKSRNTSPKTGQLPKVAGRPKFAAPLKSPARAATEPTTPEKSTPHTQASTPSPGLGEVDMVDVAPAQKHISPKSMKMWQALLDPEEDEDMSIEVDTSTIEVNRGQPTKKTLNLLSRPAGIVKPSKRSPKRVPRRRLIDALVEQAAEDSEEESSEDEDTESSMNATPSSSPAATQSISRGQSMVPEAVNLPPVTSDSQGSQPQGVGPRFTYSKQRSMLAEADLMAQLAMEMPVPPSQPAGGRRGRMASVAPLLPSSSFHDEEDNSSAAVKSVHELRKSGANIRFLDAIQDFLDRIGSPGKTQASIRRAGLLELAGKMRDKSFVEKFRANGTEQKLFLHLGQETDIVAGFIMVSLLITVLLEGSMPHFVAHLRRHGITRLLIRLLECQPSINAVAKDRKSNMSKNAQTLLIEHGDFVRQVPMWEDLKPQTISPRTIALKCLEVMVRQTRQAGNSGDIFSKELTTNLFEIMKSASDERSWDLPSGKQAIDFALTLSAIESHSLAARTVDNEAIWISDFLPIISDTLEIALARPVETLGPLQILLMRLTLNVTNNNPRASDVFAKPTVMASIGKVVVGKFKQISRFMTEEELDVALENLILALGVMINFAEWSSAARESVQSLESGSDDPLGTMLQTFAENQGRASQADSMQGVSKNVAFAYLAVLLGSFCLLPSMLQRIADSQSRKTIQPIVASIEEFVVHHRKVDMLIAAAEDGYNPQAGLTERLENLVIKLKALKVGDK